MPDRDAPDWLAGLLARWPALAAPAALLVRVDSQRLYRLRDGRIAAEYPVSTSRYGIGCAEGSQRTPDGLHCIAQKIGVGAACGEIFVGRRAQGRIAAIERAATPAADDPITSRILWLRGLQSGHNAGRDAAGDCCDSHARYIYIHGTAQEGALGRPASIGCVRMANADVIALFDEVEEGEAVLIVAEPGGQR